MYTYPKSMMSISATRIRPFLQHMLILYSCQRLTIGFLAFLTDISWITSGCMNNYIKVKKGDTITRPYPNFNGGLVNSAKPMFN